MQIIKNQLGGLKLVHEGYMYTKKEQFLIHDTGVNSSERMLVFATNHALRHLASSHSWNMDGKCNVAPLLVTHLYVIRVPLGESAVACV